MKKVVMLTLICSLNAFAEKPVPISNNDLRSDQKLLELNLTSGTQYKLVKTLSEEYYFLIDKNKKVEKAKISSINGEKFDQYFISKFIDLKYSLKDFTGNNCVDFSFLSIRGESQKICKQEKSKVEIVETIEKKLIDLIK